MVQTWLLEPFVLQYLIIIVNEITSRLTINSNKLSHGTSKYKITTKRRTVRHKGNWPEHNILQPINFTFYQFRRIYWFHRPNNYISTTVLHYNSMELASSIESSSTQLRIINSIQHHQLILQGDGFNGFINIFLCVDFIEKIPHKMM